MNNLPRVFTTFLIFASVFLMEAVVISCKSDHKVTVRNNLIPAFISDTIDGSIGLLTFDAVDGDTIPIQIRDSSGTFIYAFLFGENRNTYKILNEVEPFACKPENYLLIFSCFNVDSRKYEIHIGAKNTLKKAYVDKNDTRFKFKTWQEHILTEVPFVGFNPTENPLLDSNNDTAHKITLGVGDDDFIEPVLIQGDWLKVRFRDHGTERFGWVKWKNHNKLIIELFYFA
jgi:hypothetical protein